MTSTLTRPLVDAIAGDSSHIPAHVDVAYYLTGQGIAWTDAEISRFKAARVPILQSWTADTAIWAKARVLDVEHGALTLEQARRIAAWRQARGLATTIYISAGRLPAARKSLAGIAGITFWVANWNLTEPEAAALIGGDIVAIQYASPDGGNNNPRVPGTRTTIRKANVDLSVASIHWLRENTPVGSVKPPRHLPARKPHPKTIGGTIGAAVITAAAAFANAHGIHLTGPDTSILAAIGVFITATITPPRKP